MGNFVKKKKIHKQDEQPTFFDSLDKYKIAKEDKMQPNHEPSADISIYSTHDDFALIERFITKWLTRNAT